MKKLLIIALLIFAFTSCSTKKEAFPLPHDLFEEISEKTKLAEMYDMTDEMLEDVVGITPDIYSDAVYMTSSNGMSSEEIIIVKGNTEDDADVIEEKLGKRLNYIKKSAENYLIEEMPIIEKAVIRRDGLTVSLIVSPKVDKIIEIYKNYN
ncbi:MAG: DUF4358 domain-containing protein [Ruminococcaceae bacterium]|nr:DUF4358 domain-containing protein [Oscillospiraceae bacterium]